MRQFLTRGSIYQTDRKGMLYTMMHSVGLVQYRNMEFKWKLHLVSVVGIYSLLLARNKILLIRVCRYPIRKDLKCVIVCRP